MTESAFRTRVRQTILTLDPAAEYWKLNDRTTRGVPDAIVFSRGQVSVLEFKVRRRSSERILDLLEEGQQVRIRKLWAAGARASVFVLDADGLVSVYATPSSLLTNAPTDIGSLTAVVRLILTPYN